MEDLFVLKQEIDPLLKKKCNQKIQEYLIHLEGNRASLEEFTGLSSEKLGMNNDILHLNFEDLVDILREYDSSLEVIKENIVSPDGAVSGVASATEQMAESTGNIIEKITSQSSSLLESFFRSGGADRIDFPCGEIIDRCQVNCRFRRSHYEIRE